jgi:hypothetical protein
VKSDTGDVGLDTTEGNIYYNAFDDKFRCYQGAGWTDCIPAAAAPTFDDVYANSVTAADVNMEIDDASGLTFEAASGNFAVNLSGTSDFIIRDAGAAFLTIDDARGINYSSGTTSTFGFTWASSNNAIVNLTSSGDLIIQDNGTAIATFADDSTITLGRAGASTSTVNVGALSGVGNTINVGDGSGPDTIDIGTNNSNPDNIDIGNNNASTTLDLVGGDDWNMASHRYRLRQCYKPRPKLRPF